MLLDDLVGVIETLKERIAAHGAKPAENETRTRMALIDPLLQALGWDVSDPDSNARIAGASRRILTPTLRRVVEAKKLEITGVAPDAVCRNYANISALPD